MTTETKIPVFLFRELPSRMVKYEYEAREINLNR